MGVDISLSSSGDDALVRMTMHKAREKSQTFSHLPAQYHLCLRFFSVLAHERVQPPLNPAFVNAPREGKRKEGRKKYTSSTSISIPQPLLRVFYIIPRYPKPPRPQLLFVRENSRLWILVFFLFFQSVFDLGELTGVAVFQKRAGVFGCCFVYLGLGLGNWFV